MKILNQEWRKVESAAMGHYYRKLILFPKKARGVKNAVGNTSIRGQISDFIMFNLVIRK